MKKQTAKFVILDNYFIFLFGLQLILLLTTSFFKNEVVTFLPIIFSDQKDAIIKILPFSLGTVILIKFVSIYVQKNFAEKTFQSKIDGFVGSTIIILTLLVAVNIYVLFGYLLTGSLLFLALFIIQLVLQFAYRPTLKSFQNNFKIPSDEVRQLESDF